MGSIEDQFDKSSETSLNAKEFLGLYIQNQRRIYGFILTLVSNWSDADDILQDTTSVMWQKFSEFRKGTSFSGWGIQIARNKIYEFRRKTRKEIDLSDEVFESLMNRAAELSGRSDYRLKALEQCIKKLDEEDRMLIQMRYQQNATIKGISENIGRSVHGLYKRMSRVHSLLVLCVRQTLRIQEGS